MSAPQFMVPGDGKAIWFLDNLMTIKVPGTNDLGWGLIEGRFPAGHSPPAHTHKTEDEWLYVVEGRLSFMCGGEAFEGSPGAMAFLPRGVIHGFSVLGDKEARVLIISGPTGEFQRFVEQMGEPAKSLTIPTMDGPPDVERLVSLAAQNNIEVAGGAPPNS